MKRSSFVYPFILVFLLLAHGYLYITFEKSQKELSQNINSLFISQAQELAHNIKYQIFSNIHTHLYRTLAKDKDLHDRLENTLSTLTTSIYKYIYILYKDKKGNYRYLLDGSRKDKGAFGEKLNVDKNLWDKVFTSKKHSWQYQEDLNGLLITYLEPILYRNQTQAIIAIDFSVDLAKDITTALQPLRNTFYYIFIATFILSIFMLWQLYNNYKVKKDAVTDPLTQTFNRHYLRNIVDTIDISKYQIVMLDIDYFKQVNDTYGHAIGDNVLRDVSTLIKNEIRQNDIFVRYGGEEFILFVSRKDPSQKLAYNIAQRIRKKIEQTPFTYENLELHITISVGIACSPEHFKTISDAIKYADEMLYIAKREGRNQVVSRQKDQINPTIKDDEITINDVKDALEEDRLICYYQPIFDTQTRKITKYEALVRIVTNDAQKVITPIHFLPLILHTNLYNQMTKKVLELVFETIKVHQCHISVNLNFSDIINNDIFMLIKNELELHKDLAPWLIIELLEYEEFEAKNILLEHITTIKSYGVQIAIDDFGSGYANYSIFDLLDIDIIKIDGSLIKNIDKSQLAYDVVESIILLTKKLNITTVAEFVHSKEVCQKVQELGVTQMQGFYLAQPAEKLLKLKDSEDV